MLSMPFPKKLIFKRKKAKARKEARLKIQEFFILADRATSQEQANNLIRKAINLVKKHKTRFSSEQRRKVCKHCLAFFKQGKNVRVRTNKGLIIYTCKACKRFSKYRYKS